MKNELEDWAFEEYSLPNLLKKILDDTQEWAFTNRSARPWYRGQNVICGPIPSIFRKKYDEFNMVTTFRNRSRALQNMPETDRIDKWLFLMQHYGVPTRLLDWTESLLAAFYFALTNEKDGNDKNDSTLWVIHPLKLNEFSVRESYLPNTWTRRDIYKSTKTKKQVIKSMYYDKSTRRYNKNPGVEYFRLAFHPKENWEMSINTNIVKYPMAISANYQDMRMLVQQSCFTIHGTIENNFEDIFENQNLVVERFLLKYIIPNCVRGKLYDELQKLGINTTSVYPDIKGFSYEMKNRFLME